MARITVEDCLEVVDNRFELVLMATKRARQLANGAEPAVNPDNDKPTVLALREIADRRIDQTTIDEIDRAERERASVRPWNGRRRKSMTISPKVEMTDGRPAAVDSAVVAPVIPG